MIETKIKEVKEQDVFPALFCTDDRSIVILVYEDKNQSNYLGTIIHPKEKFGQFSATWLKSKFRRMPRGSEYTLKFIQE